MSEKIRGTSREDAGHEEEDEEEEDDDDDEEEEEDDEEEEEDDESAGGDASALPTMSAYSASSWTMCTKTLEGRFCPADGARLYRCSSARWNTERGGRLKTRGHTFVHEMPTCSRIETRSLKETDK